MENESKFTLRLIQSSGGDISFITTGVTELLGRLCFPTLGSRSLVQTNNNRLYVVSLVPTGRMVSPDFCDGVQEATNYLNKPFSRLPLVYEFNTAPPDEKSNINNSHLLCISSYEKPVPDYSNWSEYSDIEDLENLGDRGIRKRVISWIPTRFRAQYTPIPGSSTKKPFRGHLTIWLLISLLTLAIVVGVGYGLNDLRGKPQSPWMRYPTPRSDGPRYQLEFNHQNVTSWAEANPAAKDEYYIRVDDGCMFHPNLVNEQELRYQKILETRYPQLHELRMQRKYLDEGFLSDPFAIQIEVDNAFHLGHCVLALRRYWWARETGKHVCPKDLDFRHIRHCLDVFDSWVFPDDFPQHKHGQDGGQDGMPDAAANETMKEDSGGWDMSKPAWFVWKQEVCF